MKEQALSSRRRRWLVGGLTLVILAVVLVAAYWWKGSEKAEQPELLRPEPVRIVPGIYLLGGLEPAAAYVVETSDGLVLIDSGLHADLVKREMVALKLDWRRIRAILLTHVHGDHSGGAQELRAATGAKIYAGRGDAAILRAGKPREAFFSTYYMPDPTPGPTTVDVELDGDQVFTIGDVRFTALATPGHTPGSVCYLLERGGQRALFSGDIIWSLSDKGNPLGSYVAYLSPRYRGDAEAFLSTLRRLRAMPVPHLILPGHPRKDDPPQSPTITQQRWETILDTGIRDMERVLERYARDGADFLDGVPKKLLPDLYYLGDFQDIAVYGFFAESKFFLVNAPGLNGLSEFVQSRLHKLDLEPTAPAAVLLTSANQRETAGVAELVQRYHPRIVAPSAAWKQIKNDCAGEINLLAPEDLPRQKWFSVTPIILQGRGVAPMAYRLPWAGKIVLFSGTIPIKLNHSSVQALSHDLAQKQADIAPYRAAIQQLREITPNLWLPAMPADGQNANLYGDEWKELLTQNEQVFR
jgi:glyoxylase-like metal-dependent hydrolase (beta-lactamase superfamily II)